LVWFGFIEKPGMLASDCAGDSDDFGMTFRSDDSEETCVDEFWDELCDALWDEEL
jgi:hypothetical protein